MWPSFRNERGPHFYLFQDLFREGSPVSAFIRRAHAFRFANHLTCQFFQLSIRGDEFGLPAGKTTLRRQNLPHRTSYTSAHTQGSQTRIPQSQPKALDQPQSGTNAPGPDLQCRSGPGLGNYSPTGTSTKGTKACATMRLTAELLGSFPLQKPPRNVIWLLREELLQLPSSTDHPPAWQQPQGTCHPVPSVASNQGHAGSGRP